MTEALLLLVVVGLITANALFVAAEFALVSVDRSTVERAVREGDKRADGLLSALRTLSTQLSGAQLGITVTSLAVGFLIEPSVGELLSGPLRALGLGMGLPSPSRPRWPWSSQRSCRWCSASSCRRTGRSRSPCVWAVGSPVRSGRSQPPPAGSSPC